jgi:hypothetical protein
VKPPDTKIVLTVDQDPSALSPEGDVASTQKAYSQGLLTIEREDINPAHLL